MRRILTGAARLGTGVALGQMIVLLASPLISRLYSPEQFGVFALVIAISGVLSIVMIGRLDLAVPVATSDRRARDVLVLGCVYLGVGTVVISVASAVALALGQDIIPVGPALLLVPVVAALGGLFELASAYLVRRGRYREAGHRVVIHSATMTAGQLGLAGLPSLQGLIVGHVVGRGLASAYALRAGGFSLGRDVRGLGRSGIRSTARRTARFPLVLAPSSVLNAAGMQAPLILLGVLLGPLQLGLFAFAQRILSAPVALLTQSLAQIYMAETASAIRKTGRASRSTFLRLSGLLLMVALPVGLAVFLVSPVLFAPVFGAQWDDAGRIAQALSFALVAQIVAVPLSQSLVLADKLGMQLSWDAMRLLMVSFAVIIPVMNGASVTEVALAYSLASALAYVGLWSLCFSTLKT